MISNRAGYDDSVPRLQSCGTQRGYFHGTYSAGGDIEAIGTATWNNFRVTGNDLAAIVGQFFSHGAHKCLQLTEGEPFFENESSTHIPWSGTHHGQIITGSANRQLADIATGKLAWRNGKSVSSKGQFSSRHGKDGGVFGL